MVGCDGSGAAPGGLERLRDLRSKGSTIATDHAERRERGAADTVLSELAGQDSLAVHAQLAEAAEALVDCSRALDLVVLRAGSPTGG